MALNRAQTVEFKTYSMHIKTRLDSQCAAGGTLCEALTSRRVDRAVDWVNAGSLMACSATVSRLNRVGKPRRRRHNAN